jgi:hypothetical protein
MRWLFFPVPSEYMQAQCVPQGDGSGRGLIYWFCGMEEDEVRNERHSSYSKRRELVYLMARELSCVESDC